MRKVTVAATQMACCADAGINIANAEKLIREAASQGANISTHTGAFSDAVFRTGSGL